ncbi:hypothetical protein QL285_065248 [Trifolium repens]|nr:hypothetical protein QL285_065248 [Trifolium repens]
MWDLFDETHYTGIYFGIKLHAPSLHTFAFTGHFTPKLFGSKSVFSSIKHVSIDLRCHLRILKSRENSPLLLTWLVELANIESLTFFSNTLEVLSKVPDLLKVELHSLCNLKSLKITMPNYSLPIPPDKMVAFLIQNSPSAKMIVLENYCAGLGGVPLATVVEMTLGSSS